MKAVTLVPLSSREISEFVERQVVEYANEKRRAGHWTQEEAVDRSRAAIQDLLVDDPGARGHRFFRGLEDRGERVGWIWIGPPPEVFHLQSAQWLFQITVEEKYRGRGFGRGMLVALQALLAAEGVEALHLNVFKWNLVAQSLYDSLGYETVLDTETEAGMRKRLRRPSKILAGRRKRSVCPAGVRNLRGGRVTRGGRGRNL